MAKQSWKPGNMLYPLPAVLVTVADKEGRQNVFTVAWYLFLSDRKDIPIT